MNTKKRFSKIMAMVLTAVLVLSFMPLDDATRAEVAQIFKNFNRLIVEDK